MVDLAAYEKILETLRELPSKPVIDGPIIAERYKQASPRILWILREHHGENGWDYRGFVATDHALFGYRRWKMTLGLVAMVSHGLLNGCLAYGDWAKNTCHLTDSLREIAIINLNKEGGGTSVNWERFLTSAVKYEEIVSKQIKYLDPQIVIWAGTYGIVLNTTYPALPSSQGSPVSSILFDGCINLRTYHPNQRKLTHRTYYEAVRDHVQQLLPSLL